LGHLCGFNYSQNSLHKYFKELKYLGVSSPLLQELPKFWYDLWSEEFNEKVRPSLLWARPKITLHS
ncbi:MAG: hypothetical protein AAB525_04060, partial [Patescibacteria group bacterium]